MKIGILNEQNDRRVALVPATMRKNAKDFSFLVEKGAGLQASIKDEDFGNLAQVMSREEILTQADLLLSVEPLCDDTLSKANPKAILVSMFQPYNKAEVPGHLEQLGFRAFSLDMIPRTTLAQAMDVLSSMASIAGYKAVLAAAGLLPRYFPMMITAAGSIRPAKVLVLGAGVAGLQAIATAKRLGAMVEAFDVRKAAKEEVQSLGAKFIEVEGAVDKDAGGYAVEQSKEFIQRQQAEVQKRAANADVIITTAQVRGRKAPILVPEDTVNKMKPGSVIVDLAASSGGNCPLSKDKEIVVHNGVRIIGNSALAEDMPQDASTLFSNNAMNFIKLLKKNGEIVLDLENEILGSAYITKSI